MATMSSSLELSGPSPSREEFAAAVAARAAQQLESSGAKTAKQLAIEHERKQAFRRLIDPGIMRANDRQSALEALKILQTLSENVIREPRNPKYASFKPTNGAIKRKLVDVKGGIEYAVALGFHLVTQNFQPLYAYNPRHLDDMIVGNAILKERLELEEEKDRRSSVRKETEKERKEAAARAVQLAYQEDRQSKAALDEREARIREVRAAMAPVAEQSKPKTSRKSKMPAAGMTLDGKEVVMTGAQPAGDANLAARHPYVDDEEDEDEDEDEEEAEP